MNYIMNFREDHRSSLWNGQIILIGDDIQCREETAALIRGIGGRITKPLPIGFSEIDIENRINVAATIFHVSDWKNQTQRSLRWVGAYCHSQGIPLIVLLKLDLLDDAINQLANPSVEFLLTDEQSKLPAELIVTLNSNISAKNSGLFGNRDEMDLLDLKKISADVDRIARVLSQLSGDQTRTETRKPTPNSVVETDVGASVSDGQFKFSGEDAVALTPFGNAPNKPAEVGGSISVNQIRDLIKARRLRDQYFEPELFADPAWDMLLDLMAAKLEGAKVSVSSLCIAAAVPPTTALRWIKTMTEEQVFQRRADENDGRRVFIELSDEAAAGMVGYLSMIKRSNLMIV